MNDIYSPEFFSFDDSPQRKQCLRDSADDLRSCMNWAALGAGISEGAISVVSVVLGAASGGTLGVAVLDTATAANATLYEIEKNQCQNDKDHRDINCPMSY